MTIVILSFIIIGYFIFRRNIPIIGVPQINKKDIELSMLNVVDIRDYNVSYKSPIQGAINIPVSYINRHYTDISKSNLIVVASNRLERNVGVRLLSQKGFKIVGYILFDEYEMGEHR